MERRLAAILAADMVGYSRLVREDEAGTLAALRADLDELIKPKVVERNGRIVKLMGDGVLAEFRSAVEAVRCAVEIQHWLDRRHAEASGDRRIVFRIGVNVGDIVVEGDDIYGDGVNVAARLESLAEPGGICISDIVLQSVKDKLDLTVDRLGEREVKNIAEPITVYQVVVDGKAAALVTPVIRESHGPVDRRPVAAAIAAVVLLMLGVGGALWWQPWAPDVEPASIERMAFPLPGKPSIAVLPFENLSGDPKQDYLVDGITETIITELSRFGGLFVIARNSVFTYKGKPVKVQRVAEDLGVQYVLEGSMQRTDDRIRVTAQLIDAVTGTHLWAQNYDRELSDIFTVQDDVTGRIVASLGAYQGELAEAARQRAKRKDPANFSAYDALQLGIERKHSFTKADNAAAEKLFARAVELDPQFAQAHVGLAWIHIQRFWFGWTDEPAQAVARAREAAQTAISLDPSEAEAHWLLAEAHLADGQFGQGEAEYQRALTLNPNNADLLAGWGYASVLLGHPERGIEFIEQAKRLNPHYPDWYDRGLGTAAYMSQRYEDAVAAFRKVTQHVIQSRLYLAASYVRLGRLNEARAEVAAALELEPDISIEKFSLIELYKNTADLEHLRGDLRKAGLRERSPPPLPDKPSIAVLPFHNLSGDPEQVYFADGMTEDVITDLSKISGLFVIARNSTFVYKNRSVDVTRVAEELGVKFVLEGSVRRSGDQVRINAQLIDAETGGHLWADRYDGTAGDIFALQDRVTARVVESLALVLTKTEAAAVEARETDDPVAHDAFLQGLSHMRQRNPRSFAEARRWFDKALRIDPSHARALGARALLYLDTVQRGWEVDVGIEGRADAIGATYAALAHPSALAHAAEAELLLSRPDTMAAREAVDRGLALDPNDPDLHVIAAAVEAGLGNHGRAVVLAERSLRLDPRHPAHYLVIFGLVRHVAGETKSALALYDRALERNPDDWTARISRAAALAELDQVGDAVADLEIARANWPDSWDSRQFTAPVLAWFWGRGFGAAFVERLEKALIAAGVPRVPEGIDLRPEHRLDLVAIESLMGEGARLIGRCCGGEWMTDQHADGERQEYWNGAKTIRSTWILHANGATEIRRHDRLAQNRYCETYRNPAGSNETRDAYLAVCSHGVYPFGLFPLP
jgi:adenylate cyclase